MQGRSGQCYLAGREALMQGQRRQWRRLVRRVLLHQRVLLLRMVLWRRLVLLLRMVLLLRLRL